MAAASFTATGLMHALARRGEVAGAMFVSLSTAKTYVSRVYEKLGAVNRANAIMIALGLGLITPKLPASA